MGKPGRFQIGDHVVIRPEDPGLFAGSTGLIESFQPNDRGVAVLDRYVIVFKWGEKRTFYDAQLAPAEKAG